MADLVQNTAQMLRAGFGVEDIARAHAIPVSDVRVAVHWFRNTGQLRRLLGLPRPPLTRASGRPAFPKES
ncbi:hypothetical protein [Paracoccus denitrificans]|uniref:hypothetical protein n=1 Tax=Paracoccus denitrificans TaxID=266 RepID=UPI003364B771